MNTPLTPEQLAVAHAPPGPVLVVAGAGTGKTTSLVARVRHLCAQGSWNPAHVVALTHSTKAAGHLHDALRRSDQSLGAVRVRTFHALALSILRDHAVTPLPALVESTFSVMRAALRKCGVREPEPTLVADCLTAVHRAKVSLEAPPRGQKAAAGSGVTTTRLLKAYQDQLRSSGQMDFSDMLLMAVDLLSGHPDIAESVRQDIRHLVVDEYQDTDPAQQALLDLICGDTPDVTAVGDPRQAIYGFKGATPQLLLNFPKRYPHTRTFDLSVNFRSTPELLQPANRLMQGQPGVALSSSGDSGPPPRVLVASGEQSETELVLRTISQLTAAGVPHQEIAILVRFNAQTAPFESALSAAQIPYIVLDGDKFFDRREIRAVLKDAWQTMSLTESGQTDVVDLVEDDSGGTYAPALPVLGAALAAHGFSLDNPPPGEGAARDRWEAQAALLDLVASMPGAAYLPARQVLLDLADRRAQAHTLTTRAVTVTTLHKAKGMEWDAVLLPRCVDGSMPSSRAKGPDQLAEERRLLYVGLTRPRKHLVVSYARKRSSGSRSWPATPSPFLEQAGLHVDNQDSSLPGGPGSRSRAKAPSSSADKRCRECAASLEGELERGLSQCLEHCSDDDRKAIERLSAFRLQYAQERGLPLFSVFSDLAIGELVRRRPSQPSQVALCGGIGARKARDFGDRVVAALHGSP